MRYTLMLAAAAVIGMAAPNTADAYWWHGAGVGVGGLYRSLDYPTERRVPYFAAHPPVYYSQPIPRTYGHSPFAYGPDARTPDVAPCNSAPVEIINPYVESSAKSQPAKPQAKKKSTLGRTISDSEAPESTGPLTILNPFVNSSKTF